MFTGGYLTKAIGQELLLDLGRSSSLDYSMGYNRLQPHRNYLRVNEIIYEIIIHSPDFLGQGMISINYDEICETIHPG